MRDCTDIFHTHKQFDDQTLWAMSNKAPDPKAYARFKRKPYESIAECNERMRMERMQEYEIDSL